MANLQVKNVPEDLHAELHMNCPVITIDGRWQRGGDLGVTVLTVS